MDTFNTTDITAALTLCDGLPDILCFLLYVFLATLCVVTIFGNLLVIISIIYFKQLHTPTNYLVLSLAVTDLLVGVFIFPFNMAFSLISCWYNTTFICKLRGCFDMMLSTSSILHLSCISVDRYYAVCQPLTYRSKINACVAVCMSLGSWAISIFTAVIFLIWELNQDKCELECVSFLFALSMFTFYLPAIIMISIYFKIFLVAKKQVHKIKNANCQSKNSEATLSKMERKATKTLAIVLGVFVTCWAPLFLWFAFEPLSESTFLLEPFNWLGLSNSMLNPFIYAFFYSWFRSAFRMILCGNIFQGNCSNSKLH